MHTRSIHKGLHMCFCIYLGELPVTMWLGVMGGRSVFLSAAGQTLWAWGSQEVSRQKNSPGQGSYSQSTSEASEAMYYSRRKARDTPQHEGWQEDKKKEGRDGSKQRCEDDSTWGTGTCEKETLTWYKLIERQIDIKQQDEEWDEDGLVAEQTVRRREPCDCSKHLSVWFDWLAHLQSEGRN